MATPKKPEKPSTCFVQDRSNPEELRRLQVQDQLLTAGMGGVLPEQSDPGRLQSVLDVGCGTGGWLIEVAKTLPTCTRLVGVDVSHTFVEYARTQAEAAGVSDRVEFRTMGALLLLEFGSHTFDLVNHRLGIGWLRTWDWPKLLSEYRRVCRLEGGGRITETEFIWQSQSQALTRLTGTVMSALYQAGHLFASENEGITNDLAHLLEQHGLLDVQTRSSVLHYRRESPEGQHLLEDIKLAIRTTLQFVRKWIQVPEDYEQLYQQALRDMQEADFVPSWTLLTVWGRV